MQLITYLQYVRIVFSYFIVYFNELWIVDFSFIHLLYDILAPNFQNNPNSK